MYPPERIVCLTEETVETLYLLGEEGRIVGISGYAVRPPRARREKPRVSAFTSADIPKIVALKPDLVLTFSDLQADIAAALIRHGVNVHAFNQRTVAEILDMIRMLGALVGAGVRAAQLADELAARIAAARWRSAGLSHRPKVYFEEWDEPMIAGIGWVSELIEAAGGEDIFADRARLQVGQGSHRHSGRCHRPRAGYHYRFVVRQEIPAGEGGAAARLRAGAGGAARGACRNQIATDPAARTGGFDRRACRAFGNHHRRRQCGGSLNKYLSTSFKFESIKSDADRISPA